jgi:hypothetical protein
MGRLHDEGNVLECRISKAVRGVIPVRFSKNGEG